MVEWIIKMIDEFLDFVQNKRGKGKKPAIFS